MSINSLIFMFYYKIDLLFGLIFTSTFAFAKDTADVRVFYLVT